MPLQRRRRARRWEFRWGKNLAALALELALELVELAPELVELAALGEQEARLSPSPRWWERVLQ